MYDVKRETDGRSVCEYPAAIDPPIVAWLSGGLAAEPTLCLQARDHGFYRRVAALQHRYHQPPAERSIIRLHRRLTRGRSFCHSFNLGMVQHA